MCLHAVGPVLCYILIVMAWHGRPGGFVTHFAVWLILMRWQPRERRLHCVCINENVDQSNPAERGGMSGVHDYISC